MKPPLHTLLRTAAEIAEHGLPWQWRHVAEWLDGGNRPTTYMGRPVAEWTPVHAILEGCEIRVKESN